MSHQSNSFAQTHSWPISIRKLGLENHLHVSWKSPVILQNQRYNKIRAKNSKFCDTDKNSIRTDGVLDRAWSGVQEREDRVGGSVVQWRLGDCFGGGWK